MSLSESTTTVRAARWSEYPALAALVSVGLAPKESQPLVALAGRRAYLFVCAILIFVSYGALTVGRREAVGSAWALDREWPGVVRSLPFIAAVGVLEVVLLPRSPVLVRLAVAGGLCFGMVRLRRSHRARAALREHRPPNGLFVANLVSRRKGAGREILDAFWARAASESRPLCLEAAAVPELVAYYRRAGLEKVGEPVWDGRRDLVYMQRPSPHTQQL